MEPASHRPLDPLYGALFPGGGGDLDVSDLGQRFYNRLVDWILTDEKEEYTASSRPFNGGMGLLSNFGFKMPGYHVLELLAKMKGKLLHRQEGIHIAFDNLEEGNYMISEYVLDQQNGSCLDTWEGMGRPEFLSRVLERFKVCPIVLKRQK